MTAEARADGGRHAGDSGRVHRRGRCVSRPGRWSASSARRSMRSSSVVGRLDQRTMLVRGQNNIDVWGHNADRMATVLSEEIPYTLEIVPPKAPLVRNGSIDLKVVAKRAEGFTAPISLRMLYNPPGVASSGSVSHPRRPERSRRFRSPPTAARAWATWKIVVTGRTGSRGSRGGGGEPRHRRLAPLLARSFADLTVADQYYKLAFVKAAVEQGKETEVDRQDREAHAILKARPRPSWSACRPTRRTQPVEFTKDTTELVFKVTATKEAKPGRYPSLVCVTKFAARRRDRHAHARRRRAAHRCPAAAPRTRARTCQRSAKRSRLEHRRRNRRGDRSLCSAQDPASQRLLALVVPSRCRDRPGRRPDHRRQRLSARHQPEHEGRPAAVHRRRHARRRRDARCHGARRRSSWPMPSSAGSTRTSLYSAGRRPDDARRSNIRASRRPRRSR